MVVWALQRSSNSGSQLTTNDVAPIAADASKHTVLFRHGVLLMEYSVRGCKRRTQETKAGDAGGDVGRSSARGHAAAFELTGAAQCPSLRSLSSQPPVLFARDG